MGLLALFILAVGLSMDAFAVAVCKGLSLKKVTLGSACLVGGYFGLFQALMPLLGYLLGSQFQDKITAFDHWIAFILLLILGVRMIRESQSDAEAVDDALDMKTMLMLAVATSIDALAVGITLAFLQVNILPAITFIGIVTFLLSALGVKIGHIFGIRYKSRAELVGGMILILIGTKILFEHLAS